MLVDQFATPGLTSAVQGFAMMMSLIVAIGAQNSFLLRQGILRSHVTVLVLICWLSDVVLVTAGVGGLGAIVERAPVAMTVIRFCGAIVLFGYAAAAIRRLFVGERLELDSAGVRPSLSSAVAACLAITWLNPHVYLDTVLMIGGVANSHGGQRWWFAAGSMLASVAWFAALGYGARLLRGVMTTPRAWRILDAVIAAIMIATALRLLAEGSHIP
ncbi:LysE/ArgO family amino acid transporter [Microlunatus sp. Gsoil 973]|uniref:LysE/ArgO family amino acid transporter n=1 Tax=Microlunatus sp. Gsoil 973 TaxID=2672569 RepID=UPI001E5BE64F|nr:LysE/ArgO family amino acid transporter [Microlunatus sp. Gsoil 973]